MCALLRWHSHHLGSCSLQLKFGSLGLYFLQCHLVASRLVKVLALLSRKFYNFYVFKTMVQYCINFVVKGIVWGIQLREHFIF